MTWRMTSPSGRWSNAARSSAMRRSTASGETSSTMRRVCGLLNCTAPRSHGMITSSASESPGYHEKLRTDVDSATAIALRWGGRVDASAHCVKPM